MEEYIRQFNGYFNDDISRREFIHKIGIAATCITITTTPFALFPRNAEANPLSWLLWTGRTAFAAGIGWLVRRLLDRAFPPFPNYSYLYNRNAANKLADRLKVNKENPKPTTDRFHNRHASQYAITNENYHFDAKFSRRCGHHVELNRCLCFCRSVPLPKYSDLSTPEIKFIARAEQNCGIILSPCGKRQRPSYTERNDYNNICRQRRIEHNRPKLEYVRHFSDGCHIYPIYAVKNNNKVNKPLFIYK